MVRLLFWGILIYLGWKAFQIVRDSMVREEDSKVHGRSEQPHIDISEEDIQDAEFKDLKEEE